jgi:hypothetical protein
VGEPTATVLRRAEATLRHDRQRALVELERVFAAGAAPEALSGPLRGRLVSGAVGHGIDAVLDGATRLAMPWRGKAFDPELKEGRNLFVGWSRPFFRVLWPGYRDFEPGGLRDFTAFRFETSVGGSVTHPGLEVLRIDYDHPASPWPVRTILDELVHVGDGQHLGQALMRRRNGGFRRVAWFALALPG